MEHIQKVSIIINCSLLLQIVRSVSHWSAGFLDAETWEESIHEAYVDIISKAQHYVYIENQFFITLASIQVRNQVGDALYKRILRAHRLLYYYLDILW